MTDHTAPRRRLSNVKFRVLVAGRANAGKTSILQRVCDTTESPKVYRLIGNDRKEIHLHPTSERGEHNISDELEFSNHKGYVFHDSCGLESGVASELQTLQTFVRERSGRKRLQDRVHAIWYCIPMDDDRPSLNIAPLRNIHVDENVPVIAVFTKFETFRLLTKNNMIHNGQKGSLPDECEKRFTERYLSELGKGRKVVRLERMHKPGARCDELVETTMKSLDPATVMLMLLAVQTQNLALNVKHLVSRGLNEPDRMSAVRRSLVGFPILCLDELSLSSLQESSVLQSELQSLLLQSEIQSVSSLGCSHVGASAGAPLQLLSSEEELFHSERWSSSSRAPHQFQSLPIQLRLLQSVSSPGCCPVSAPAGAPLQLLSSEELLQSLHSLQSASSLGGCPVSTSASATLHLQSSLLQFHSEVPVQLESSFLSSSSTKALILSVNDLIPQLLPNSGPGPLPQTLHNPAPNFIMIGLILVLRFAALTYINTQTDRAKATKEAFAQYSACNWGAKVEVWLAASPRTAEEVFAFINSIPWDLVPKSEDKDGSL